MPHGQSDVQERAYVEKLRKMPGTIDLSGNHEEPELAHEEHHNDHHDTKKHDHGGHGHH